MAAPNPTLYLPLNPFAETRVEEKHVWGVAPLSSAPQMHEGAFQVLTEALDAVRTRGHSQCCFLVGASGAGKTHLIAKLRREYGSSLLLVQAAQPPSHTSSLAPYLLRRVCASLNKPARLANDEVADFTQLQALAYALLKRVVEQDISLEELHEAWLQHAAEERLGLVQEAAWHWAELYPQAPAGFIHVLLATLLPERRRMATEWLAGNACVTDEALASLQVTGPLPRAEFEAALEWLGRLARQVKLPLILVLDSWDLTSAPPLSADLPRVITSLIEQSRGWLLVVTATTEQMTAWRAALPPPARESLDVLDEALPHDQSWWRADLPAITPTEQLNLLRHHLAGDALVQRRKQDWIASGLYPFSSEDILDLVEGAPLPGPILRRASDLYRSRLQADAPPLPLPTMLQSMLEQGAAWEAGENAAPDATELGGRLVDFVRLMTRNAVAIHQGPLPQQEPAFEGVDLLLQMGPRKLRLVTCHAGQPVWSKVLERLTTDEATQTLLCRYGRWPLPAPKEHRGLKDFQSKGGQLHWVTALEWRYLAALGKILDHLRAGRMNDLLTQPRSTESHVTHALRRLQALRSLPISQLLRQAWRSQEPARVSLLAEGFDQALHTVVVAEKGTAPPNPELLHAAQAILAEERWLEVGRLQRHLVAHGHEVTADELSALLATPEVADRIQVLHDTPFADTTSSFILWVHEA